MPEPTWIKQPNEDLVDESLNEVWDPAVIEDFEEVLAKDQPGNGGSYARDDATETIVGLIPFRKSYDFRRKALGYAYCDDDSPWKLHRVNPMVHPDETQLRAVSVDIAGLNPMPIEYTEELELVYRPYREITTTVTVPRRINYTRGLATIKFRPLPYPFLDDADMGSNYEWARNCTIFDSTDPRFELVAADTEPFLIWAQTPTDPHNVPAQGTSNGLNAQTSVPLITADLVMIWHQVPLAFVAASYLPNKIMSCVGCVNDEDDWLAVSEGTGFPRGTLRLQAPRIKVGRQAHLRINGTSFGPWYQSLVADIILPFTYANPPLGEVDEGDPLYGGFNVYPFAGSGKFYSVARKNNTSESFFPYKKFDRMFTHVGDVATQP